MRQYMRRLYSHSREHRKIFLRSYFPHVSHIWEGGVHFSANTCRACIRTRANTGKYSWGIIYVVVSGQGVIIYELITIRHEKITYPKKIFSNYFPITVSRFRFLRINFRKLPDTYCICVSCVTLPPLGPLSLSNYF